MMTKLTLGFRENGLHRAYDDQTDPWISVRMVFIREIRLFHLTEFANA
ncbi:hypothetical protein [Ammoniphilus resinae]|nr:hypothetical protein [Ammoniphilus resinae]